MYLFTVIYLFGKTIPKNAYLKLYMTSYNLMRSYFALDCMKLRKFVFHKCNLKFISFKNLID